MAIPIRESSPATLRNGERRRSHPPMAGLGADPERAKRPAAVPRERMSPRLENVHSDRHGRQASTAEILRSKEGQGVHAGTIRRIAAVGVLARVVGAWLGSRTQRGT